MHDTSRPRYQAVLSALPSMLTDGSWQRVVGEEATVTSPLMVAPKVDARGVLVKERVCSDWRVPNSKVMADCELLPRVGDLISHANWPGAEEEEAASVRQVQAAGPQQGSLRPVVKRLCTRCVMVESRVG
jgi:hypothetical protein